MLLRRYRLTFGLVVGVFVSSASLALLWPADVSPAATTPQSEPLPALRADGAPAEPPPVVTAAASPPAGAPLPGACASYITIQPDNQGIGHAHFNRDAALQVALGAAARGLPVCFAFPPAPARHLDAPNATWDAALGFGGGFAPVAALTHLRRAHVPVGGLLVPVATVVQYIVDHFEPQRLYVLRPHQDTPDHCATAATWAAQYHRAAAARPRPAAAGCSATVAVHVRRYDLAARAVTPTAYFAAVAARAAALVGGAEGGRVCTHVFARPLRAAQRRVLEADFRRHFPNATAVHLDADAVATLHALVAADVLVLSRSKFSLLAALLHRGVKLVPPTPYRTCGLAWVPTSESDASFVAATFLSAWRAYRQRPA